MLIRDLHLASSEADRLLRSLRLPVHDPGALLYKECEYPRSDARRRSLAPQISGAGLRSCRRPDPLCAACRAEHAFAAGTRFHERAGLWLRWDGPSAAPPCRALRERPRRRQDARAAMDVGLPSACRLVMCCCSTPRAAAPGPRQLRTGEQQRRARPRKPACRAERQRGANAVFAGRFVDGGERVRAPTRSPPPEPNPVATSVGQPSVTTARGAFRQRSSPLCRGAQRSLSP
jgi:hypothetical protein